MSSRLSSLFTCALSIACVSLGTSHAAPKHSDQAPEGLTVADWQGVRAAHEAWQHRFVDEGNGAFSAVNPAQGWRTEFDGRGFVAKPDHRQWQWGLELESYGVGDLRVKLEGQARVETAGSRLSYHWNDQFEEWFLNDTRGLEQGWTLKERPPGNGPALRLELATRGGLEAKVSQDHVAFSEKGGGAALTYGGLKAWDATGRALPVRFVSSGKNIVVEVEEHDAAYPVTVDPLAQQAFFKASNTDPDDRFGFSVAVSGNTVVVGAVREDTSNPGVINAPNDATGNNVGINTGAAYVFVRNGGTWTQQAFLKPHNPDNEDGFGWAVAISGDTIVVGARNESSSGTGIDSTPDNTANQAGAAYVFVRSGTAWSQQAYLKPHNTDSGDWFGVSVALAGDTAVVGADAESGSAIGVDQPADNTAALAGAAYVFVRSGTTWTQQAYLKAHNTEANDRFGVSVAISGNTIAVGASGESGSGTGVNSESNNDASTSGAVYTFVRNGFVWSHQAYLKAHNTGDGDGFGSSVAISGSTIVVGATGEDSSSVGVNQGNNDFTLDSGAAYIFDLPPAPPAPPSVKISGKKKVKTTKGKYTIKGTAADADNDLRRVEARDARPKGKKKYRPAKGTNRWRYKAPLKLGNNKIRVRAADATGRLSRVQTITVIRK